MLIIGVGTRRGVSLDDVLEVVDALAAGRAVGLVVTAERKSDEPALVDLAACLGCPLQTYGDSVLAAQPVSAPSHAVTRAVGVPSVAEAAVLAAGGVVVDSARSGSVVAVLGERDHKGAPPGAEARVAAPRLGR